MVKMTSVISTQSLVHIFIIKGKGNKIFAITIISVFFFNEFNAKFMQHEIFGAEWQHALKELMLQYKQHALIELMLQYKQYALKGQKLLAQGTTLGY